MQDEKKLKTCHRNCTILTAHMRPSVFKNGPSKICGRQPCIMTEVITIVRQRERRLIHVVRTIMIQTTLSSSQ